MKKARPGKSRNVTFDQSMSTKHRETPRSLCVAHSCTTLLAGVLPNHHCTNSAGNRTPTSAVIVGYTMFIASP